MNYILLHSRLFPHKSQFLMYAMRITYLLTYSMEQSPSSEANWFCS